MSVGCGGYDRPLTRYQRFSDWCCEHEEVLAFIRTVAAVIGTVAVIIILVKSLTGEAL